MYWTTKNPARIWKSNMDGSNSVQIVGPNARLVYPGGILVDRESSSIFWTDHDTNRIQSSGWDGQNVRTLVQLEKDTGPWGIGLHNGRIYWGNWKAKSLQSSDLSGQDIRTVYGGSFGIWKLTVATADDPPSRTRPNHCEGQICSKICLLTPSAYRCL